MDGEAVKQLAERFATVKSIEPNGGRFIGSPPGWAVTDSVALQWRPAVAKLAVNTLGAVRDYLKANRDTLTRETLLVHILDPCNVVVLGPLDITALSRQTYLHATCLDLATGFTGKYWPLEDFLIGLQTRFAISDTRDQVLRLLANVKDEKVKTALDDGMTQVVTAKTGVVLVSDVAVPNPVELMPYRTFREVFLQPESPFVLRVKSGPIGGLPEVALFEADGGAWKLTAIDRVQDWLVEALDGTEVEVLA